MPIKIAINGFGRVGRTTFRAAFESRDLKIVAINDLVDSKTLVHLLKYDSVYGIYEKKVTAKKNSLVVDGDECLVLGEKEPEKLPWKKLKVDIVLECTGRFTKREEAQKHLKAGASQVILSAPCKKGKVKTLVMGVNENQFDTQKDKIVSNASCTTNCLAPVAYVLNKQFGIEKGLMSTIHAYTADQRLVDAPHKDLRRARAAGVNIIPTSTGAAIATAEVIPELKGKFHGLAFRVPTLNVSVVDLVVLLKKNVTVDRVNKAFIKASKTAQLKKILAVSRIPLVSTDLIGNPYSAIVDLPLTEVQDKNLVKVVAWYDNEWGYSKRLVDLAEFIGQKIVK